MKLLRILATDKDNEIYFNSNFIENQISMTSEPPFFYEILHIKGTKGFFKISMIRTKGQFQAIEQN